MVRRWNRIGDPPPVRLPEESRTHRPDEQLKRGEAIPDHIPVSNPVSQQRPKAVTRVYRR
jgi:hypothetical protein